MNLHDDAFVHHPELRGCITNPMDSFARSLTLEGLEAQLRARNLPVGWWYSDAARAASLEETLAACWGRDLWVFAYGSLIWDPGFRFAEVRRAHVADHARRLILRDIYGGRGTPEAPGLMAALDRGSGCDGLVFRIAADHVADETRVLWQREMLAPAYKPRFVAADTAAGPVEALTFVADHDADLIVAGITRAEQVCYAATGEGFLGTSLDYLRNICAHFEQCGMEDGDLSALLRDAERYRQSG